MSEIPSRTEPFPMQDRSQGGIFFSSPQQKLKSLPDFNSQATYTNFFAFFGTRTSSNDCCKISKSPNCPLETGQHLNHCLSRRYVANEMGRTLAEILMARDIDFSIATF